MEKAKIVKEALESKKAIVVKKLSVDGLSDLQTKFIPWGGEYVESGHILFQNDATPLPIDHIASGYGLPAKWSDPNAGIIEKERTSEDNQGGKGCISFSVDFEDGEKKSGLFTAVIKVRYNIHTHIQASGDTDIKMSSLPDYVDLVIDGFGTVRANRETNKSKFYAGVVKVTGLSDLTASRDLEFVERKMPNAWPPAKRQPTMAYKLKQVELSQDPFVEVVEA